MRAASIGHDGMILRLGHAIGVLRVRPFVRTRCSDLRLQQRNNRCRAHSSSKQESSTNALRSEISPLSNLASPNKNEVVDVGVVAARLGVHLTSCERDLLKKKLVNEDGIVTCNSFTMASQLALKDRTMREICLQVVEQPTNTSASFGTRFVRIFDYIGLALFSIVGTQVAGDAGYNIVGCTLVGCITGLGGRSINQLLYGSSSPLLKQAGVFWVRNPIYLAIAIGSSIFTFFAWPVYCSKMSEYYLEIVIGKQNLEEDGSVGETAFVEACQRDEEFLHTVEAAVRQKMNTAQEEFSARQLFHFIDLDNSGTIDADELKLLVQERVRNSPTMYTIETAALACISVAGVHGALSFGLPPFVAATSGVTMSLGGILRDLLCGRDLAAASQSYAFATGAGSSVYVLARELAIRGYPIVAAIRIALSLGTTVSLRWLEYARGEPLLSPMHGHNKQGFGHVGHARS